MWSETRGASPVRRCTCAASEIFSKGSRGTPGEENTLKRVPALPKAHEGSSMVKSSSSLEAWSGRVESRPRQTPNPSRMKARASVASSMLSSHMLRQIGKVDDSVGWTTSEENDSKVSGAVVADVVQRAEELLPGDRAGAEVPAVRLAEVDVAELAGGRGRLHRLAERDLLDVHVVRVEVRDDVVPVDVGDECQRLLGRVEHVGLVAVAELQPKRDAGLARPGRRAGRSTRSSWPGRAR